MTSLDRTIRRECLTAFAENGRPLMLIVEPCGIITLRPKGMRKGYSITLRQAYDLGAKIEARRVQAEKQAKRAARKVQR